MAIIKQYHRDTDTTYVYDSTSYWDSEKGQSRSRRKCIGKIDPATGEIIPTGRRGRRKKDPVLPGPGTAEETDKIKALYETVQKENIILKNKVSELEQTCSRLSSEKDELLALIKQINMLSVYKHQ